VSGWIPWCELRHEASARQIEDARLELEAALRGESCAECGRAIGDQGRWYSDGAGELVPYYVECAGREFGV
jgi:hypothetical protein